MKKSALTTLLLASSFGATTAIGGVVFTDDLSSGAAWTIASGSDSSSTFGYDYSADGIPAAPNGTGTVGLKLEANQTNGVADEIAAVHALGFSGTAYRVSFDMWGNFSIADGSSTEFFGGGVGHDGTTAGRSGASLIVTGDGGSARDFRLYKGAGEQFFASLQYGPGLASNNGSDPLISSTILGQSPPAAQGQAGTSDAGDAAFQWITMEILVDPNAIGQGTTADPGTAQFTLTPQGGSSIVIGTIDNSNGGGIVSMEGNISLVYADLFSSLAGDPQFQFGIFDNVVVETIPEPSIPALLMLVGAGFGLRRRR